MAGFDRESFLAAELQPREEAVPVDGLRAWFSGLDDDEVPRWRVRGLTHPELAHAKEAADRNRSVEAVAQALAGDNQEKIEAIKEVMGTADDVPQDTAKRMEMLRIGSVDPEADLDLCIKLAEAFPVEFQHLTDTIVQLTGQGHEAVKKPGPSGDGET
ncbi:MAG TPA: hypothetical protein VKA64_11125 [Gammaproteobacteria bacterium]|nr:hypothetical protein [Gammaproteobacteria bacterium]